MRKTFELALRGSGLVSPNPMVGCVLAKGGKIVAQGWHPCYGGPHAEAMALRKAGKKARGCTAYVNLEPCGHWGKTPPCADALVRAGIRKVVAAVPDPNPLTAGKGTRRLRSAGIPVRFGLLAEEARHLNRAYFTWIKKHRPYVLLKAAVTLDGKIATRTGESQWITGPQARSHVHELRSRSDAVLVGIGTVLQDNPELTSHGKGKNPLRIVLDTRLRIPADAKLLSPKAPTLVVTSARRLGNHFRILQKPNIFVMGLSCRGPLIPLRQLLKELAKMSIQQVLVEGGGEVHASFLKERLADEVLFFIAPKIVGGRKAKTAVEGEGASSIEKAVAVRHWEWTQLGPDLLFHGYLN